MSNTTPTLSKRLLFSVRVLQVLWVHNTSYDRTPTGNDSSSSTSSTIFQVHELSLHISAYHSSAVHILLSLHAHCRDAALCGSSHNCACISILSHLILLNHKKQSPPLEGDELSFLKTEETENRSNAIIYSLSNAGIYSLSNADIYRDAAPFTAPQDILQKSGRSYLRARKNAR